MYIDNNNLLTILTIYYKGEIWVSGYCCNCWGRERNWILLNCCTQVRAAAAGSRSRFCC